MSQRRVLLLRHAALLLAFAACLGTLLAQEYRARVQGFVTDPTKAAVVGAKVTLRNERTGIETTRTTGETGLYLFDLVEPGVYTIQVEAAGFARFTQSGIVVQTRGDVTVDATLRVGDVTETVEVRETVTTVEFNTASMSQAVTGKMLQEVPILTRSPFIFAILNPAAVGQYWDREHNYPFYSFSHGGWDIGGSTGGRNALLLDGVDTRMTTHASYAPTIDALQEFVVMQNPVDAEYGNSAGAAISMSTKSGTNELHGSVYYFGRNPALNALPNRVTREPSVMRNHIGGGVAGGPVYLPKIYDGRNKAFWFLSFEKWKSVQPGRTNSMTLPTDLERTGDFSRSLNKFGNLRTIYDPMTTVLDVATNRATRTPFPGNRIPASMLDRAAVELMKYIWQPNNPGIGPTQSLNWKYQQMIDTKYNNLSLRGDYQFNDRWRMFARYSWSNDSNIERQPVKSVAFGSWDGSLGESINAVGNLDGTLTPSTFVNFRYGFTNTRIDFSLPYAVVDKKLWESIWPNRWWELALSETPEPFFPYLNISGGGTFGNVGGWNLHPDQHSFSGSVMKQAGSHYMKWGGKLIHFRSDAVLPWWDGFNFSAAMTSSTFINPPVDVSGDPWASFLLGYPDSGATNYSAWRRTRSNHISFFFQDDWKVNRRLTLNLGVRYEYDQPPTERDRRLSRFLDLSAPIPELQPAPPNWPDLSQYGAFPPRFNGAFYFLDDINDRLFWAPKDVFLPRVGLAYRIDEQTSFRFGYSRYAIPFLSVLGSNWYLPNPGFNARTPILEPLEGKPRTRLFDPFPANVNPVQQPVGNRRGRYHQLGDEVTFFNQYPRQPVNDRINFSVQRQLPQQVRLDVTFFMNFGHDVPYPGIWGNNMTGENENMMDPALWYRFKSELNRSVPNPFYNLLPVDKFPGPLRYQPTVRLADLLKPYPHYTSITQVYMPGRSERYRSLQIRLERSYAAGFALSLGYNYGRGLSDIYFNDDDRYARRYTLMDNLNFRHQLTIAPVWELPFGRGRRFGNQLHPVLDAIFGGWTTSHLFLYQSGRFLEWGQLKVNGDPRLGNRTRDRWFRTEVFAPAEPFTPRTNPRYYEGLTGPAYWTVDSTLVKNFRIKERARLELRMEAFSLFNHFIPSYPDQNVYSTTFGQTLFQRNYGREMQYTIRLHF